MGKETFLIDHFVTDQLYLMSGREVGTDLENNFVSLSTEMGNSLNQ